jgi:glutamyl-tRNA synthetase/glutamyl-Q tRNA(Asp) synthetase
LKIEDPTIPVSRFAPAPTGHLHIGHVVNAVFVWGVTRAAGGRVLLRIEDHDRSRSRAEFEASILHDLGWLGFVPDGAIVRQRDREPVYAAALQRLRASGLVYACECSRSAIAAAGGGEGTTLRYPGTCATKGLADAPGRGVRIRLEPGTERFVDVRHGLQEQRPSEQSGDLLARDRDGQWTYQFAVTVDDLEQGVTLVIRGDDLLSSTGRQIQLARLLGRQTPPRFCHHPLVMKSASQKLSKSGRDSGVADLREQGWTAERVIGHAVCLSGLASEERPIAAADVPELFDRAVSRSSD